jgi:hypothetical protein
LDKTIIALSLIAVIAAVSTTSIGYYLTSQTNQTQNNPSPTSTPPPTPTPSPTPTPTPTEEPTEPASKSKLAVPEFTLKYVDNSYDVPSSTTTETNPYTGDKTVTTEPGYHVENGTIEVIIKNQEFTPYPIDSQHTISLFYYVSYKGHYAEDWDYYPPSTYGREYSAIFIRQSTSDYTVVQFRAPSEGEMDFRVQAQIGYYTSTTEFIAVPGAPFTTYTFNGEVSGWSSTQTITIP